MFGLFKSKEEKVCDEVGMEIHRQISSALKENPNALTTPEHMIFFYGYLGMFLWGHASNRGMSADWTLQKNHHKYICEGVIPGRLWDIYERGESMYKLGDAAPIDVSTVYETGTDAASQDSVSSSSVPDRLYLFLTNQDLDLPDW